MGSLSDLTVKVLKIKSNWSDLKLTDELYSAFYEANKGKGVSVNDIVNMFGQFKQKYFNTALSKAMGSNTDLEQLMLEGLSADQKGKLQLLDLGDFHAESEAIEIVHSSGILQKLKFEFSVSDFERELKAHFKFPLSQKAVVPAVVSGGAGAAGAGWAASASAGAAVESKASVHQSRPGPG